MTLRTGVLLRYCRRRLRQLDPLGHEPKRLVELTRADLMLEASRGQPRLLARAQADIFREISTFILRDMEENVKQAPYVLQAWVNGTYFYYNESANWLQELAGAKTFESYFEAEAFVLQNFDPNEARDSILVVPISEGVEHA
jgi:hypothetical protein